MVEPMKRGPESGTLSVDREFEERRDQTHTAVLSRRLDALCVNAVDELHLAAGIEAAGINDRIAQATYGRADVFELAGDLYRMVPSRPSPGSGSTKTPIVHNDLLRGVAYLLPALLYVGVARVIDLSQAAMLLLGSLVFVWAASQGMVFLQQRLLGRVAVAQADAIVRRISLVAASMAVGAIAAYVLTNELGFGAFFVAAGQACYFLAASVLFSVREERRLVLTLLPAVVLSLLVAFGPVGGGELFLPLALVATVVAVVRQAWQATASGAGAPRIHLAPGETRAGVIHVFHGVLWAGFVLAGTFVGAAGLSEPTLSLAAVPLVLSLGVAEWQVRTLGERTTKLLGRHTTPGDYEAAARVGLWVSLGVYGTTVASLALLLGGSLAGIGRLDGDTGTMIAAYVLLGFALFFGSALIARGRAIVAAVGSGLGLMVLAVLDGALHPQPGFGAESYFLATLVCAGIVAIAAVIHVPKPVVL